MSAITRIVLLALCAAAPFPQPQAGLTLEASQSPRAWDIRSHEAVVPRFDGEIEEITVTGHRAPMQADPHAAPLPFRDAPQGLQAADLWAQHIGRPPRESSYETDVGGQPGRP